MELEQKKHFFIARPKAQIILLLQFGHRAKQVRSNSSFLRCASGNWYQNWTEFATNKFSLYRPPRDVSFLGCACYPAKALWSWGICHGRHWRLAKIVSGIVYSHWKWLWALDHLLFILVMHFIIWSHYTSGECSGFPAPVFAINSVEVNMGGLAVPWGNLVQFSGPGEARATEQSRGSGRW